MKLSFFVVLATLVVLLKASNESENMADTGSDEKLTDEILPEKPEFMEFSLDPPNVQEPFDYISGENVPQTFRKRCIIVRCPSNCRVCVCKCVKRR